MSKARALAAALFALAVSSGCWEQVDKHWFDQMKNGPQNPVTLKLVQTGAVVFPLAAIPAYTDGMIFYKIWYGKPNMPGYPQIPEEDRWHIINYLRTMFKGVS